MAACVFGQVSGYPWVPSLTLSIRLPRTGAANSFHSLVQTLGLHVVLLFTHLFPSWVQYWEVFVSQAFQV